MCVCVGVCVCGCVVCVVWVAHISIVKTKKLRFFRIFTKKKTTKKIMELPFYLFVCYRGNGSLNPLLLLPSPPQDKAK